MAVDTRLAADEKKETNGVTWRQSASNCFVIPTAFLVFASSVFAAFVPGSAEERQADLFVSPAGNDHWSGQLATPNNAANDGPFATWERARDEIRNRRQAGRIPPKGIVVEVQAGRYHWQKPLSFTAADSGTPDAPIVWRAASGPEVRVVGGVELPQWTTVADPAVLARLDESVRGKIVEADLKAVGIANFGDLESDRLELFYDDRPMTIARYPNKGLLEIAEVLGPTPREIHGVKGKVEGVFQYSGDRPARWALEPDGWLHGYWFWDWADQRQPIESLNVATKTITLKPPHHHYGYRKGQWFYAFNMLCELDEPGEWHLDRAAGKLYFYPPTTPPDRPAPKAVVSLAPRLVEITKASRIELRGFVFEAARGTAIRVADAERIQIADCTIRNIGETAVEFDGGRGNSLTSCDIYQIGRAAVVVLGGDRKTLSPAEHVVENCEITAYGRWKPMYSAGISINGVGIVVRKNLIHDAPHMAILFRGNDHLLEANEIHHVCLESNDAGAIYSGRDWTWRGTIIRQNYLHHITGFRDRGCLGVYLDDMLCGTQVVGNLFYRVKNAVALCGGRDCRVESNVFVECEPAVHVDDRALNWANYHALEWIQEARDKGTLMGIAFDKPPYSTKYPELARMMQEDPAAPRGNVVANNLQWRGSWTELTLADKSLVKFESNRHDEDPRFDASESARNPLPDDSAAYRTGFQRIPVEQIGLRQKGKK